MEQVLNIKKRRPASLEKRKARSGYVFVLPFLVGIVLIYLPILIDSLWFSFYKLDSSDPSNMVYRYQGFESYAYAFTGSSNFVTSLLDGLQQLIFEVPAVIIFALFIAVVLNNKMLGRAAFRAIFFVPVIISTGLMEYINGNDLATAQMSGGIDDGSNAEGGIINMMQVETLFRDMAVGGNLVTYVVNLVNDIYNIINYSGVQMLIFLAGLQSISESIYEACRIDGATGWETFWKITFPMISPMILVNAVYTVIDAFTRSSNVTMVFIKSITEDTHAAAMYWIYFMSVILIIALVAGIVSTFTFYQRKD